jgi:hypothetical protein
MQRSDNFEIQNRGLTKARFFNELLIAYASIALGFCIAGLTISLTFPDAKFTARMSELSGKTSPYSDLLFVFSWTAIAHWCAVVAMFVVILLVDGAQSLLPSGHSGFRL